MTGHLDGHDHKEKKVRPYDLVALISLVLTLVIFMYAGYFTREYQVSVTTAHEAYPYQMFTSLKAGGKVVIGRQVSLASRIPGELASVLAAKGALVKKGQLLATIEDTEAVLSREQGEANLKLARANLEQAGLALGEAEALFKRERDEHPGLAPTDGERRLSEAQLRKAKTAMNVAQATVRAQETALRRAELVLGYTRIYAPFDGIVLSGRARAGDMVRPVLSDADESGSILTLADLASLEVEVEVPESQMENIRMGQPCEIVFDLREKSFKGEVETVVPPVGKDGDAAIVRVGLLEKDPRIMPDMNAQVSFLFRQVTPQENKPLVVVERSALVPSRGGYSVFRVSGSCAEERAVRLGRQFKDQVEVVRGIALGDVLVASPPDGLKNGARISVRKD